MLQRIITGACIAILMIVLVVFSGTWFFPAFMTLLTVMGTYEMLSCIGTGKNGFIAVPAIISALASAVCAYFFGYAACVAIIMLYLAVLFAMCVFFDVFLFVDAVCNAVLCGIHVIEKNRRHRSLYVLTCVHSGMDYRHICLFYRSVFRQAQAYSENQPQEDS